MVKSWSLFLLAAILVGAMFLTGDQRQAAAISGPPSSSPAAVPTSTTVDVCICPLEFFRNPVTGKVTGLYGSPTGRLSQARNKDAVVIIRVRNAPKGIPIRMALVVPAQKWAREHIISATEGHKKEVTYEQFHPRDWIPGLIQVGAKLGGEGGPEAWTEVTITK